MKDGRLHATCRHGAASAGAAAGVGVGGAAAVGSGAAAVGSGAAAVGSGAAALGSLGAIGSGAASNFAEPKRHLVPTSASSEAVSPSSSSSSSSSSASTSASASSSSLSASSSGWAVDGGAAMGMQPLSHAVTRLPHLVTCTPSGGGGGGGGHGSGHGGHGGADQNCSCVVKPRERTILHGILTGQGHKYGYGECIPPPPPHSPSVSGAAADSSGLRDTSDHSGLYPDDRSLDDRRKVHSREVTSPSKSTIQLRDK